MHKAKKDTSITDNNLQNGLIDFRSKNLQRKFYKVYFAPIVFILDRFHGTTSQGWIDSRKD